MIFDQEPDELREHTLQLQKDLLESIEDLKKAQKPVDYASGFAMGVQIASMYVFSAMVEGIIKKDSPAKTIVLTLKMSKELHEIGHILNGEEPICSTVTKKMLALTAFVTMEMIKADPKEDKNA